MELPTRFVTICLNLPGSPITISGTLSETNAASFTSPIDYISKIRELSNVKRHHKHHSLVSKHPARERERESQFKHKKNKTNGSSYSKTTGIKCNNAKH
jgi:hypothetical protein